jgi:hypothetical protein
MTPSAPSAHEKREFATELKFLLDPVVAERVRAWMREQLVADPHGTGPHRDGYHIASLYFDTPDLAVFHRRDWLRHSKFRIRRYNDEIVFLERKLKIRGRVSKRRSALTLAQFAQLHELSGDVLWFRRRTVGRRLQPVCQIDYQRTARVLVTPVGPIRVTLDEAISAAPVSGISFHPRAPGRPLTDRVVLELKFRRELPVLFRDMVGRFTLNPQPFSKYRTAMQALGLASDGATTESSPTPPSADKTSTACRTS